MLEASSSPFQVGVTIDLFIAWVGTNPAWLLDINAVAWKRVVRSHPGIPWNPDATSSSGIK
jgi:hypothetical protein